MRGGDVAMVVAMESQQTERDKGIATNGTGQGNCKLLNSK